MFCRYVHILYIQIYIQQNTLLTKIAILIKNYLSLVHLTIHLFNYLGRGGQSDQRGKTEHFNFTVAIMCICFMYAQ